MRKTLVILALLCSFFTLHAQQDDRGYIVKVGDMAPDIDIVYVDGQQKKLSDFRGKLVMIQFTASWCHVCRTEMPFIEKDIWQKHKDNDNFVLLGIDLKETKEKTISFTKEIGITYPLTLDLKGDSFYSFAARGAGVTRNIIIDPEGKIILMTRLYAEKEFKEMCREIDRQLEKMEKK